MADIQISSSMNQFTFTLENMSDSLDTVERTLSIEASDSIATARSAAQTFINGYMASFANGVGQDTSGEDVYMGSLIQPTNWRDDDDNETAYKCTGITCVHVKTTKNYFDL